MTPIGLLGEISSQTPILIRISLAAAWLISRVIYSRYLHPLAHVPGPFWASISELYRFYHNFAGGNGALYLQFEGLREKYGPVIRITPNEALLADPAHYDKIYSMTSQHYRDADFLHPCWRPVDRVQHYPQRGASLPPGHP
ncbi:hypothetical protein MFIFM68171_05830 [Madurella fahalii]|uniref:Cytochrome P450 n=1 Tax=Madurella fahalii TaxID=1157608 RepID=A0ABQ0GCX6_9PEZI